MRTIFNYESDSHLSENQGVIKNSILNDIPAFLVVPNYYVDIIMHDVFEGYAIIAFLMQLIISLK